MLGRAYWTMMHAFSVYLAAVPTGPERAAFRALFEAIYHVFPCPVRARLRQPHAQMLSQAGEP